MKKLLSLFIAVLCTVGSFAQTKDEQEVTAAVDFLKKAMIDGDRANLAKIAAEELVYGHSSGKVQNKAEFVEGIASGGSDFVTIDLTDQLIKVSGNTAVVHHKLSAQTNDGGKPGSAKIGVMLVFQKQKGQWKLLARQAFKLPV
ncbi:nuclear transport factor 2 family protein [Mucilaginibacter myungsuensis]|uniref:Nuclear transport factor 2 family protein n=1 Tax=Mucilaginibacter myungsuensis TaxID=649104 RepID=A0A929PYN1_9SPHI|nr:nuclear transport factor 2 family protein [Mucilaginibacter myungsuensis]MBE9664339.1 nuclear transport factor 2 family protein [Mucilaginibacter myungsuensis]MDN3597049.1 nuclear transport factor 2 family protein [Mucilaginibacter myungsuensis]